MISGKAKYSNRGNYIMLYIYNPEQVKEIKKEQRDKQQKSLAGQGISSAIENGQIVTVGDADRDYLDWKEFVLAQIARLGWQRYCNLTGWDIDELIEDLAEEDQDSTLWSDDAKDYFGAVEGDY